MRNQRMTRVLVAVMIVGLVGTMTLNSAAAVSAKARAATRTAEPTVASVAVVDPVRKATVSPGSDLNAPVLRAHSAARQDSPAPEIAASTATTVSASVSSALRITGTVTNAGGTPISGVLVWAYDADGWAAWTTTAAGGTYALAVVAGTYTIRFEDYSSTYPWGWYSTSGFAALQAGATPVVVGASDVSGINVSLPTAPTVPSAPTGVTATPGNALVAIAWIAPTSTGGSAITGYTATASPGGATCASTGALSCTVTGLTNGTAYTFTVVARNAVGTGPASAPSAAVTPTAPPTVPSAPTGVIATAGNASAGVTWIAPTSTGGSAITGYTATASPGGATCASTGALSCTVTGLTNGTAYTFTVVARNAVGTGPASAPSAAVTPTAPVAIVPVPPTAAINALPTWRASTSIRLAWRATAGTAAVASYDVQYRRATWKGGFGAPLLWRSATTATGATFGAATGSTYCFSVRARDSLGTVSAWTAETCTAIPLDDRALSRVGSWSAGTGSAYYKGTYLRSTRSGAKLVRTGVVARRIAIVATTCPTCGTVKVFWGSTLLRTIKLTSTKTVNRKLIAVTTFTSVRKGTLTIKVSSTSRKVIIDGVAIRRN